MSVRALNPRYKPVMAANISGRLLQVIAEAFADGDSYGSTVEDGSIDTQGLSILAGPFRFRLEIVGEPELLDWAAHSPALEGDRDLGWMDDSGEDVPF
jgi:hypothetical protein